jgi:hypothetical protein
MSISGFDPLPTLPDRNPAVQPAVSGGGLAIECDYKVMVDILRSLANEMLE